ncbi:MAG: chorismate-binding protein, partial [Candidatus Brocadiia bacterium]|nr:chorismate-binding protein [Candidatus Brocadiia bacterium]
MQPNYIPDFAEFKRKCELGNVVPVYRQLMADILTPVSAFQKIADGPHAFLLESAAGPEKIGRHCFLGASPFALFRSAGGRVEIREGDSVEERESDNPLRDLRDYLHGYRLAHVEGLSPFSCGAVGYMGYDVARFTERLPDCPPDDRGLPDVLFMFFDEILIFDNLDHTIKVVCSALTDGVRPEQAYERAKGRIDALIAKLRTPVTDLSDDITPRDDVELPYTSNTRKEDYFAGVERCKEYIRAGDIFQVVPSQRLEATTGAAPLDIYRALRVINPSPYMFLLKMDDLRLVGSSPEVMVGVENRKVRVRP